ncbi:hypothetical protein [Saccharomonospora piscinae]|nr:hypothetical protein [Saccharomonospora piscinae]
MADVCFFAHPAGVVCLRDGCDWTQPATDPDQQTTAWQQHDQEAHRAQ